jgi:hypothetical protein
MSRNALCLALAALTFLPPAALAAEPPELLARSSGDVTVQRESHENPVMEIARSIYWGAAAGSVLGLAIMLADKGDSGEPLRWGFVIGAFAGLGAGIYFVAHRPQPASQGLLEFQGGRLVPRPAPMAAIEPVPGGARVRAITVRF